MTKVLAMVPWPMGHCSGKSHPVCKKLRPISKASATIFVIGAPVEPTKNWTCGTDVVWPVYEMNGKSVEPYEGRLPHVCRHQIVAGD